MEKSMDSFKKSFPFEGIPPRRGLKDLGYLCYCKKKRGCITHDTSPFLSVHPSIELLNLWEDFRKVVKFIDENHCWLNPLLERITKKEPPLKDFQHLREGERTCY